MTKEELIELDELVTPLVRKGQPIAHILAAHGDEIPVCKRTLYSYISKGYLSIKNIDMYEYPVTSYEHQFAAMLRNSTKPMVVTAANRESIKNIAEMMAVIRGGMDEAINKPLIILYDEPISPLNHYYESIDKLIYCAENSLPTNYAPAVMMGGTGPMTLSGALCQCLAESLLGLVVHQLANPGAPFIFGGCVTDMDLKCMHE